MDENNAVSVLENLIETCKDGQKGYQDAASHVKRPDLKTYFLEQSLERGRFAEELQGELRRMGDPDKKVSGSVSAASGPALSSGDSGSSSSRATLGRRASMTAPTMATTKRAAVASKANR